MPATALHPIDSADVLALRQGSEAAFERIFRALYRPLLDEANAQAGVPGAGARIVEGAFLRAWEARGEFDRAEVLDQFLTKAVHDIALREKTRRNALHRFEAHEHVKSNGHAAAPDLTTDQAWQHLTGTLHTPAVDPAVAAQHRAEASRHEAAHHMAEITQRRNWRAPAIGFVVLAAIAALGIGTMSKRSSDFAIAKGLAAEDARVLRAMMGQRASVTLGDETQLLIGADSKVTVPPAFSPTLRGVKVEGTASFTVTKPAGPNVEAFQVRLGQLALIATGTIFDVRTDLGADVLLRVREGTVQVKQGKASTDVATGRTVRIDSAGTVTDADAPLAAAAFDWVGGTFTTAPGATLREVLPELRRWYRLDLVVTDSAILANPASFSASLDSSKDAIAALEAGANVKFGYAKDNETMQLSPAPAATAKKATK
jgi:DNA-directed RNA polymerase specialized sigma24 family protein